jgi:hypothetical protein
MAIRFHPHARERMQERGAEEDEIVATIEKGERSGKVRPYWIQAKFPFQPGTTRKDICYQTD